MVYEKPVIAITCSVIPPEFGTLTQKTGREIFNQTLGRF